MAARPEMGPGRPFPLGASWDGEGINFALFSSTAEAVDLCLFDPSGAQEIARHALPERSDDIWHGHLAGAQPGLLYGYRVHGPYRPEEGLRFNANKLLLDPYARSLQGRVSWHAAHLAYDRDSPREDLAFSDVDNAAFMPKCRVVDPAFAWEDERRPAVPGAETIVYELHVRAMTMRHPAILPAQRGSIAALAAPEMIDYLLKLGVTAVELLPIQACADERHLIEQGLINYWGYNTIGFFAPDPLLLSGSAIAEVKTAVKRLHAAGIEVILDVVYNHTGEGDHLGPTLCFRGIDNAAYYRLETDPRYYVDDTGTGNTLNLDHPRVLQLVLDSLRYWVGEMHVDGFRFDLATTLGRTQGRFAAAAPFFAALRQDPLLAPVKLIAEPWDLGPQGYQLGHFPPGWAEWNDRYRDGTRRFWKGERGMTPELASRLAGSSDIFAHDGRSPWASVNFVTCHDGFTLQDLVSYDAKHNEANGEHNRDGSDGNNSWNCGVEGQTQDPEILALRDRQKRNFLATLFLSLGVPMLLMGDESGRSQSGNNNAYCQDELSWVAWEGLRAENAALRDFVRFLVGLRRRYRVFSQPHFFRGEAVSAAGLKDITWLTAEGQEAVQADWENPAAQFLGYVLGGGAIAPADGEESDRDACFLVLLNAHSEGVGFRFPELPLAWQALIDTVLPGGIAVSSRLFSAGEVFALEPRSFALFIGRAA